MILMVPISPEVPRRHIPRVWPALMLMLMLTVAFVVSYPRIEADFAYVNAMKSFVVKNDGTGTELSEEAHEYLKKRPLLVVAPAKGDWDLARLIYANFLHGSLAHMALNLVGVFAGARICSSFIPFSVTLAIFILGGSLGLLTSMWLSTEASAFIPHIGASGGIFALMGTYYVYNFRYRTRYFFWFPSRRGTISLRTATFFFVDVILLELVLSTAQFLPDRLDSVDHLAHVVGFGSGVLLALILRTSQGWSSFLQTRSEFLFWRKSGAGKIGNHPQLSFNNWCTLLTINPCNDQAKRQLCHLIRTLPAIWSEEQKQRAFAFLSPTFLRLHTAEAASAIAALLNSQSTLPASWLAKTPYDSIIRISQAMANSPEQQGHLFDFVSAYRRAHPEGGNTERKLEVLLEKLSAFQTATQLPVQRRAP